MQAGIPEHVFTDAVRYFWATRDKQGESATGGEGQGRLVRGGKQMDGFAVAIFRLLKDAGIPLRDVFANCELHETGKLELPGFFRPTKKWDMLIVRDGKLLAALELKSQVGPSFGNNFNNRTEEAMGSALDLWTAFREGILGTAPPWLGYLFLLEECPRSLAPVRALEPHFKVFPEFKLASYARRYELLCRKLVLERHYQGSCFLLSQRNRARKTPNYHEPADDLAVRNFIQGLLRHVTK